MNSAPSWSLKIWQIYDTYANLVFWDILSALKRIFYSLPAQWLLDRGEDILGFYKTADEWKAHDFGTNFGAKVGFFFNSGHFARVGPNQWNVLRITKKSYNRQLTIYLWKEWRPRLIIFPSDKDGYRPIPALSSVVCLQVWTWFVGMVHIEILRLAMA